MRRLHVAILDRGWFRKQGGYGMFVIVYLHVIAVHVCVFLSNVYDDDVVCTHGNGMYVLHDVCWLHGRAHGIQ